MLDLLYIVAIALCNKCQQQFQIHSSTQVTTHTGSKKWSINLAAVLSQMSTGGRQSRLNNVLRTMGVPEMRKSMFKATEDFLGEAIKMQLLQSMIGAGQEEKCQAVTKNHIKACHTSVWLQMVGGQNVPTSIHTMQRVELL